MTTRDRILHCAIAELQDQGLEGLSLRAVGKKAGITPMAIYRHFADKAALLRALGDHALSAWQTRVEAIEPSSPAVWFAAMTSAYVAFALDEPALFDAAFVLRTTAERVYPEDFRAGKSPVISGFVARLTEGQITGVVRPGDPLDIAMTVWAALHGLVGLYRSGRFSLSRADFTAMCQRAATRICMTGDET